MQIRLLVPSKDQKKFPVQVPRNEAVSVFRKIVANVVQVPENSFLLIAFGKIMLDKCADQKAATLFSTYRIRHKSCVFVHINNKKTVTTAPSTQRLTQRKKAPSASTPSKRPSTRRIIRDNNVVSIPFGDFKCPVCQNNEVLKKCIECGCTKCLYKTGDPLICDQCDNYWHIECAGLTRQPTDHYWYCPDCINKDTKLIVGKGVAVNEKALSKRHIIVRDMICVVVPAHHVGKIPGIFCGQSWGFRSLVHDWGMHRANIPAVAGSSYTGAVSLVLSGGLKHDKDVGYEFVFSGGGGDLRTRNYMKSGQMTQDQQLTRYNKALAITCNAPLNDKEGAKAYNWRKSRPIRVCRASNRKNTHPTYAPEEGIRYDGLYKVVKYWPHRDKKTGFIIWKFLFRRDDQEPPPWMNVCRQWMSKRGIRIIRTDEEMTEKLVKYTIPTRIQRLMKKDIQNQRLWDQISKMEFWSEYEFLHYLFDTAVTCSSNVCSKPIKDPVTTACGHICCVKCLTTSKTDYCFTCRSKLPPNSIKVNDKLTRILQALNWAYDSQSDKIPLPSTLDNIEDGDMDYKVHPGIKQEEEEYPSLSDAVISNLAVTKEKPKRVTIHIEYLGDKSAGQSNKKRRLN